MRSVVQLYPGPPSYRLLVTRRWSLAFANDERPKTNDGVGAVAQLGERLVCNQEATGSIPVSSTRKTRRWPLAGRLLANAGSPTTKDPRPTANSMLGVNATTDSVSRFKKVAWRRTLGWKEA